MSWRDSLRPASFRGVSFKVDNTSCAVGRRGMAWEFPKGSRIVDEDLGRRARRFAITAWVIGPNFNIQADALEAALNQETPGQLVLPLMGTVRARCETYTRGERRVEGGLATFDLTFVESPSAGGDAGIKEPTQAAVDKAADAAERQVARSANKDAGSDKALPTPIPVTEAV